MPSLMLFRYDVRSCQIRNLQKRVNFGIENGESLNNGQD